MTTLSLSRAVIQSDTVVTVASRDAIDVIFGLAAASIAATFVALLLVIAIVLLKLRSATKALGKASREFAEDPGVRSLRAAARNVEAISEALRNEMYRLSASVGQVSDRIDQTSDRLEERIEEFNALLEVIQGEAEEAFVDSAAAARGVRAGLGSLGKGRSARSRRETVGPARVPNDLWPPSPAPVEAGAGTPPPAPRDPDPRESEERNAADGSRSEDRSGG